MEKVKLKKEVYKTLSKSIEERGKIWVLDTHYKKHYTSSKWINYNFLPLNEIDLETMCDCMINGYELDED